MLDSLKIEELIKSSSEVFITAHKNIDFDALGSILGMYYVANKIGKNVHVVIDDEDYSKEMKRAISSIKELDIIPKRYNDIKDRIDNKSLLIVTDVNVSKRLQNIKLLDIKNRVVIDHHIETKDCIDTIYKYIDIMSSSACELVLKLINNLNIYIPSEVATIMLSGIYVDTNGFSLKTTKDTHESASLLYQFGADTNESQYLLKQNFNEYKRIQKLVLNTEFYDNIAITTGDGKYLSTDLAKSSDTLLRFNSVEASFTIAKLDDNIVGISARSLGNIDVASIMNKFNGGGHKTDAAAQIKDCRVSDIKDKILEYLGGLK
ncbi:MAG: DHH family phosphoesterase [Bacilli bacterium]|nr:DHH family phosphoesterase [Bacilli bacterium]